MPNFLTGLKSDKVCEIGFLKNHLHFSRDLKIVQVPLVRSYNNVGKVKVSWSTREDSAEVGKDFVDSSGIEEFRDGQSQTLLDIPLLPSRSGVKESVCFIVELGRIQGDAAMGIYETVVHLNSPDHLKKITENGEILYN